MRAVILTRVPQIMHDTVAYMAKKEDSTMNAITMQAIELHPRYFFYKVELELKKERAKRTK